MSNTDTADAKSAQNPASSYAAGQKVAGCYILKQQLDTAGPLTVWLARDEELNKDITLHFLPTSVVADTRAMTELRQETKRNRQLIHPHIVRVHDLIEETDWVAISMDYAEGESVAALLSKRPKHCFDVSEIKGWIAQLCQTLEDAHKVDLLHRDLVPENLMVRKTGDLALLNFGITRAVFDSLERLGQKPEADRRLAYTSPQLLDGERPGRGDDIYSLGALMFELLTGQPPFHSGDLLPQIRKTVPPAVSARRAELNIEKEQVPKNWDREIAACLDKHTPARPKTAMEVASKLGVDRYSGPVTNLDAALAGAAAGAMKPAEKGPAGNIAAAASEVKAAAPAPVETGKKAEPAAPTGKQTPPVTVQSSAAASTPADTTSKTPAPIEAKASPATQAAPTDKEAVSKTPPMEKFTAVEKGPMTPSKPVAGAKSTRSPIAEAEIVSKTTVPPASDESSSEPAVEISKAPPKTPQGREFPHSAFVTLEDQKKRALQKARMPMVAAFAVAAVLLILGVIAYMLLGDGDENNERLAAVSTVSHENGELTTAGNVSAGSAASPASTRPGSSPRQTLVAENTRPSEKKTPANTQPSPVPTTTARQLPAGSGSPATERVGQAEQQAAERARAAEALRQALAVAEKGQDEKASAQKTAEAAAMEAQAGLKEKAAAAVAASKAADDAFAAQKQREDAQKAAETAAEEAQKLAADRTRLAVEARKAAEENVKQVKQAQIAKQRAESELQELQKLTDERTQAAKEAAKAVAAAEAARQAQAQAVERAAVEMKQAQAKIERVRLADEARKAAAEAEALRAERAKERERLTTQAAAAQKAAEEATRLVLAAQKAEEEADKLRVQRDAAQKQAEAAAQSMTSLPGEPALPAATPIPAAPAATPAASATPRSPSAKTRVDAALQNSLGMKFALVGDVLFSVWQTRVRDFETFATATNLKSSGWRQPGFKQGPDHPVVYVTWNDAIAFCKWLTETEQKEGLLAPNQSYRLPTDLEWSKAVGLPEEKGKTPEARDMDVPDVYPWGTDWPPPAGAGNYTGEETGSDVAIKGFDDGFAWTAPVGSFKANKFGLHDMGGNVWQWCMDWLNAEQKAKVLRGGSWYNGALKLSLLSSCRDHAGPDSSTDNRGFRVVLGSGGKKQ